MANEPMSSQTPVTAGQLTQVLEDFGMKLEERIVTRLETKIEGAVDTLARAVQTGFDDVYVRLDVLQDQQSRQFRDLRQDVSRVDIRLSRLQDTSDENKIDIAKLSGRTAVIEKKLAIAAEKV